MSEFSACIHSVCAFSVVTLISQYVMQIKAFISLLNNCNVE